MEARKDWLMQTLEKFLNGSDVALRCREVTLNGNHASVITEPWAAQQYQCELHGANGDRPVKAIIGSDNGTPELPDVLDGLAAEAAVVDQARRYEQWAVQMGFDPDSRHGERVYRAARRQAKLLRELLGDHVYEQLLWQTERL
jgi:hypothetical protein